MIFAVLHATWLEPIDVRPGLGVGEGEVVWADANDFAVLLVKRKDLIGETTGCGRVGFGKLEGGP